MNSNAWLTVAIKEGRNREVRNIMEYLGYPVTRLLRLSYGPFLLGRLEAGKVEEVKASVLAEQLGLSPDAIEKLDGPEKTSPTLRLKTKKGSKARPPKSKDSQRSKGQKNTGRKNTGQKKSVNFSKTRPPAS